jgi:hypothetical protein
MMQKNYRLHLVALPFIPNDILHKKTRKQENKETRKQGNKESFLNTSSQQIHNTFEACKESGDEVRFFNEGFSKACFEDSFAQLYGLNETVAGEKEIASSGADNPLKAAFNLNKSVDDILPLAMEAAAEYNAGNDGNFTEWASQKYGIPESGRETMKQVEQKLNDYAML